MGKLLVVRTEGVDTVGGARDGGVGGVGAVVIGRE
jgi:hypothetical protein